MSSSKVIEEIEQSHLKSEIPAFKVGDTIRVHTRIIEGNKERVQVFMGTVIARKGSGVSETFSVYRNAYGSSMERVFVLHSPRISKIEVAQAGRVRRAKLYYLRGASGKAAKVQQEIRIKESKKAPIAEAPKEKAAETEEEKKAKLLKTAGKAMGTEQKTEKPAKNEPEAKKEEPKKEEPPKNEEEK